MSGQTRSASSQFSSWFFAPSPPMNVLTSGRSIFSAAVDDGLEMADDRRPVLGIGVERVGVEAEAGDRQALGLDLGADLRRLAGRTGSRRRCGSCRRSGGSGPSACGQQAISSTSKPAPPPSRRPPSAASRGTGRSGSRASSRRLRGGRRRGSSAIDVDPAALAGALERPRRRRASRRGRRRTSRSGGRAEGRPATTSA